MVLRSGDIVGYCDPGEPSVSLPTTMPVVVSITDRSFLSSSFRVAINCVSVSGADRGTPAMGAADLEVVALLDDDEAEALADDVEGELDAAVEAGLALALDVAVSSDGRVVDGTAAVPPTLAQEASARVATARLALIKIGRALARPCDMSSFCQQE